MKKTVSMRESVRGAVLVESLLAIPVIMLLILGGFAVLNFLYTKSVVEFSLQEGIRIAQHDPRFQVDLFSLNPANAVDLAKINDFKRARTEVVQKTLDLINQKVLLSINLQPTDIDGVAGVDGASLALLPPHFSGRVGTWGKDVHNQHKCEVESTSIPNPKDPEHPIIRARCKQETGFYDSLKTYPTEFHAYTSMNLPFYGEIKSDFSTSTYLSPTSAVATPPVVTVPPQVTEKPQTPLPGTVVGGYSFEFNAEGRGNGGVIWPVSAVHRWGQTYVSRTLVQKDIPACNPGLKTVYVLTQQEFSPGYTPPLTEAPRGSVQWESGLPRFSTGAGGWNITIYVASFLCTT